MSQPYQLPEADTRTMCPGVHTLAAPLTPNRHLLVMYPYSRLVIPSQLEL